MFILAIPFVSIAQETGGVVGGGGSAGGAGGF